MKSCFFIGHHDAPDSIQEKLDETVEFLVTQCAVTELIVGYHGNFDRMAAAAIQRAVQKYPRKELTAWQLEPYFPGDREIRVPHYFEGPYYPEGMEMVPPRFCIEKANQKALAQADYLVAYVRRSGGNAAKLRRRAGTMQKRGEIRIIDL